MNPADLLRIARHLAAGGVGSARSSRDQAAWEQAYRALEHGYARNQCNNLSAMSRFPVEIREFGRWFVAMQRLRHAADYAPDISFSREQVEQLIDETEEIIVRFSGAPARDRRGFATHVLFRLRRD